MTTTETAPQSTETTETTEGSTLATPEPETGYKPPREKRYREERNQAREALIQAEALIGSLRTREIERLAGEHLAQPADLLELGGVAVTDLLTEAGYVDDAAVAEAVAALLESRPGLAKNPRHPAVDPTQGMGRNPGKGQPTWADLLK
jgi:hypothetical protein